MNLRQMKDGTWTLKGAWTRRPGDPQRLLTSRIKTDSQLEEDSCANAASSDTSTVGEARPAAGNGSESESDGDQEVVDTFQRFCAATARTASTPRSTSPRRRSVRMERSRREPV